MGLDVKEVHVQDLAAVLEESYDPTDVADEMRRFEAGDAPIEAAEDSVLEGLRALAGTDRFKPVLASLLEGAGWTDSQRADLEAALEGSSLFVRAGEEDSVELVQRIRPVAERTVGDRRATLMERAPDVVRTQIEAAESHFGAGEYDLAAAELRRAMDVLAVGGFEEALEELAEAGFLTLGDDHQHTDATLVYVTYGYCSFLGADPEVKGFETSQLQAELAVVLVEEVVHFLLETLAAAEDAGEDLQYWELS